jgi:hypothetical protein
MKRKEIKKLYLLQTRFDKKYYTQESELIKSINRWKGNSWKLNGAKILVFDYVGEFDPVNYVEGRELENVRDLKMKVLFENNPTAIKIEKLKNLLTLGIKSSSLNSSLNLITDEGELKNWVIRNRRYLFNFKTGDLETEIEWFQLILSIHNFNLNSLNSRYYFNSTLEEHPFYLAKRRNKKK